MKWRAHEGLTGESHQRFLLRFPLRCSELGAACGGSESAPLRISRIMTLEIPFVTQTCTPCASLQLCSALTTTVAAPAFYAGFEAKQNISMAEDVCQERCYICEKLQDSMSVRQIFTEDAAK